MADKQMHWQFFEGAVQIIPREPAHQESEVQDVERVSDARACAHVSAASKGSSIRHCAVEISISHLSQTTVRNI